MPSGVTCMDLLPSPLTRGEWIEIRLDRRRRHADASPLTRGEWIEIRKWVKDSSARQTSPLARGEWIEIRWES